MKQRRYLVTILDPRAFHGRESVRKVMAYDAKDAVLQTRLYLRNSGQEHKRVAGVAPAPPEYCTAGLAQGAGHRCTLELGHGGLHCDGDIAQWSDTTPGATPSIPKRTE